MPGGEQPLILVADDGIVIATPAIVRAWHTGCSGECPANEDSMSQAEIVHTLKDIHRRVQAMEQILPTLATREELKTAITEESSTSAVRLREEGDRIRRHVDERLEARLKEQGEQTRSHMEIIAERMHDDVRLIAESQVGAEERFERHRAAHRALAQRVTRLEDAAGSREPRK